QEMKRRGYRLKLAPCLTETIVSEPSLVALFHRERRWNQAIRTLRPIDHALSVTVHALPAALVLLVIGQAGAAAAAIVACVGCWRPASLPISASPRSARRSPPPAGSGSPSSASRISRRFFSAPLRGCRSFLGRPRRSGAASRRAGCVTASPTSSAFFP